MALPFGFGHSETTEPLRPCAVKSVAMTNKPYPCRLGNERLGAIATLSKDIKQSVPTTLRLVVDEGIPIVRKKFAKKK